MTVEPPETARYMDIIRGMVREPGRAHAAPFFFGYGCTDYTDLSGIDRRIVFWMVSRSARHPVLSIGMVPIRQVLGFSWIPFPESRGYQYLCKKRYSVRLRTHPCVTFYPAPTK